MTSDLLTIRRHTETLEDFAAKYHASERFACVQPVGKDAPPKVAFFDEDHAWAISTFGADGWLPRDTGEGWINYSKPVDGVEVTLFHLERSDSRRDCLVTISPSLQRDAEIVAAAAQELASA